MERSAVALDNQIQRGVVSAVEVAQVDGRYTFKGVATATGVVDRMKRVFLPGAFTKMMPQVPLLAYHDDSRPVGISKLTKKSNLVLHQSSLANIQYAAELEELIKAGAIPATSIGWTSEEMYWGYSDLEKGNPKLVKVIEDAGIEKSDDIIYFAKAEILENSVTPVPAMPLALISVASMFGFRERGAIEAMQDLAKGVPQVPVEISFKAPEALQKAHDVLVEAGAVCEHTAQAPAEDGSENTNLLIAACDQALDEAIVHGLVEEWDETMPLILAADQCIDQVMDLLGIPDADEEDAASTAFWAKVKALVAQTAAQWTTQYINDLPDSAFAYIEPSGKKDDAGKTVPRSNRHFPHHDSGGAPDAAHVRNALARIPQSTVPASAKASALAHIEAHAKKMGIGDESSVEDQKEVPADESKIVEKEMANLELELADLVAKF